MDIRIKSANGDAAVTLSRASQVDSDDFDDVLRYQDDSPTVTSIGALQRLPYWVKAAELLRYAGIGVGGAFCLADLRPKLFGRFAAKIADWRVGAVSVGMIWLSVYWLSRQQLWIVGRRGGVSYLVADSDQEIIITDDEIEVDDKLTSANKRFRLEGRYGSRPMGMFDAFKGLCILLFRQ